LLVLALFGLGGLQWRQPFGERVQLLGGHSSDGWLCQPLQGTCPRLTPIGGHRPGCEHVLTG
jgi:hypothetical protein